MVQGKILIAGGGLARLQLMSRAMGDHVYHPAGPHAALRNAIMSAESQAEWLDTLEWLYGGNGLD